MHASETSALGIDAGTTETRWRLVDRSGAAIAAGAVAALSGIMLVDSGSEGAALAVVDALARAVLGAGRPAALLAGVTGLSGGTAAAARLGAQLALSFELTGAQVRVVDDIHVCYRGVFEPGGGILVYAGTGSIAYHLARDGSVIRAGGHGYLIDDAGGGFWIGRQALKRVLRQRDRMEPDSALAVALADHIGRGWDETRGFVYGGGRAAVARLAPLVAEAAAAGDADAAAILKAAGAELAQLARVLIERLGSRPVALAGGAAKLGPILWKSVGTGLPSGIALERHEHPPVETAARLALEMLRRS